MTARPRSFTGGSRRRGHRVEVIDFLDAVAFHIGPVLRWFYQVQLRYFPWSYEFNYQLAPLLRAPAIMVDTWLTRRKLRKAIKEFRPDTIVSVYPLASLVLGRMRARRPLRVPVRHLPHRLRRALALGAPRHRPSPCRQRALGRGGGGTRRQGRPCTGPAGVRPVPRRSHRPRGGPQRARPRTRGTCGARGRGLVGRGRRRRHRRGDRRSGEFHPVTVCGQRREAAGRAREPRLRHRHRLDRRDARAHDRGRRAGRERRRPHRAWRRSRSGSRSSRSCRSPGTARTTPR